MSIEKCVVVIPRYKKELNEYEQISLTQCQRVLEDFSIFFVSPVSMNDYYCSERISNVVFFKDDWFLSQKTYSDLLLTREFYEAFINYEYMFIYQLDGFVFKDRLSEFCDLKYDFIGAPMNSFCFYKAGFYHEKKYYVGNGGVSLRNIEKILSSLEYLNHVKKQLGMKKDEYLPEDMFFSYMGFFYKDKIKVCNIDIAKEFAIEYDIDNAFNQVNNGNLPFAVHGWCKKQYIDFWGKIISNYGYNVHYTNYNYKQIYFDSWIRYILAYFIFYNFIGKIVFNEKYLRKNIIIWGAGRRGKKCYDLLNNSNIKPVEIYDNQPGNVICDIKSVLPFTNINNYRDVLIIITPKTDKSEIKAQISNYVNREDVKCVCFDELLVDEIEKYYGKSLWDIYIECYR